MNYLRGIRKKVQFAKIRINGIAHCQSINGEVLHQYSPFSHEPGKRYCVRCTRRRDEVKRQKYFETNGYARSAPVKPTRNQPDNCELCDRAEKPLVVDHDHETNKFRGWLCRRCNVGLALVDAVPLEKIKKYLEI